MNQTAITGRLVKDPEIYMGGENPVAKFTIACNRPYSKDKEQTADFIHCVTFGNSAVFTDKYLRKGSLISVVGHIQTGSYENKEGKKVYTTDVICERIEAMEKLVAKGEEKPNDNKQGEFAALDDIPF